MSSITYITIVDRHCGCLSVCGESLPEPFQAGCSPAGGHHVEWPTMIVVVAQMRGRALSLFRISLNQIFNQIKFTHCISPVTTLDHCMSLVRAGHSESSAGRL